MTTPDHPPAYGLRSLGLAAWAVAALTMLPACADGRRATVAIPGAGAAPVEAGRPVADPPSIATKTGLWCYLASDQEGPHRVAMDEQRLFSLIRRYDRSETGGVLGYADVSGLAITSATRAEAMAAQIAAELIKQADGLRGRPWSLVMVCSDPAARTAATPDAYIALSRTWGRYSLLDVPDHVHAGKFSGSAARAEPSDRSTLADLRRLYDAYTVTAAADPDVRRALAGRPLPGLMQVALVATATAQGHPESLAGLPASERVERFGK